MNITLTGFMGTGKTSVGKRLAKRLGWRFVDLDQLIEASAKMSIARIFTERGEAVFRRLERRCISRAIRSQQQVIATGGGAFIDPQNRARLRISGPVVCLTATPQAILQRVGNLPAAPKGNGKRAAQAGRPATRPLLAGGGSPLARIRSLLRQRAKAYAQADLTIDTTNLSIDEVVERIWEHVSPCLCKSWQYLLDHSGRLANRYGGKYVVVVDDRVVASGQTQLQAYQNARLMKTREAGIYYIPLREESLTAF